MGPRLACHWSRVQRHCSSVGHVSGGCPAGRRGQHALSQRGGVHISESNGGGGYRYIDFCYRIVQFHRYKAVILIFSTTSTGTSIPTEWHGLQCMPLESESVPPINEAPGTKHQSAKPGS